jgi:hypothetical protein
MAGLADLFGMGGGGMFGGGGGSPVGASGGGMFAGIDDLLTPQMRQALAQRSLMGFLAGMQKSGALDYTAPFISGRVPAGFSAGLAGGMSGMAEGQDKGLESALKTLLTGGKLQEMKSKSAARDAFMKDDAMLLQAVAALFGQPTASATAPGAVPDTIASPAAAPLGNAMPRPAVPQPMGGGIMGQIPPPRSGPSWLDSPVKKQPFLPNSGLAPANGQLVSAAETLRQQILAGDRGGPMPALDPNDPANYGPGSPLGRAPPTGMMPVAQPPATGDNMATPSPSFTSAFGGAPAPAASPLASIFRGASAPGGADPSKMQALLLALARKNSMAEVMGMGNPYKSYIDVLQGSPQYRGNIAGSEAGARQPFELDKLREKARLDLANAGPVAQAQAMGQLGPEMQKAWWNEYLKNFAPSKLSPGDTERRFPMPPAPIPEMVPRGAPELPGVAPQASAPGLAAPQLSPGAGLTLQGQNVNENRFGTAVADLNAKEFFARRGMAQEAATSLESSTEARKLLDSGVITGTGATYVANLGKALRTLGFNAHNSDVPNTEAFAATRAQEVGRIIKLFGSGTGLSNADREYAERAAAGQITLDEQSIRRILEINDRASRTIIEKFNSDAERVPSGLSPYPLTVKPPGPDVGKSGVTSSGVRWRLQ